MQPNIAALEELASFLEGTHPTAKLPEHYIFDMRSWFYKDPRKTFLIERYGEETVNGCETTGCALGYACTYLPTFKKLFKPKIYFNECYPGFEECSPLATVCGDVGLPLGITSDEFWYMFSDNDSSISAYKSCIKKLPEDQIVTERAKYGSQGREDAAARIRCLIADIKLRELEDV